MTEVRGKLLLLSSTESVRSTSLHNSPTSTNTLGGQRISPYSSNMETATTSITPSRSESEPSSTTKATVDLPTLVNVDPTDNDWSDGSGTREGSTERASGISQGNIALIATLSVISFLIVTALCATIFWRKRKKSKRSRTAEEILSKGQTSTRHLSSVGWQQTSSTIDERLRPPPRLPVVEASRDSSQEVPIWLDRRHEQP